MLDEAVYTSGFDGSRFDLNCGLSAFGKPNGLHSYEWEYDLGQGRIAGASRRPYEAEVDVALMDADEARRLIAAADRDVEEGTPGTLSVNGWVQRCHIVAMKCKRASGGAVAARAAFAMLEGAWRNPRRVDLLPRTEEQTPSLYEYDLPHDLAPRPARPVVGGWEWGRCPVAVTFYGPCLDPSATIAGNVYAFRGSVAAGESVRLDGLAMEATRTDAHGTTVGCLASAVLGEGPGSGSWAFEPLPRGTHQVEWDGSFALSVEWHETSGVPPWAR